MLGHNFRDPGLLRQALTHRSAGRPHNERLEFLGDALLNLIVAEALYQRLPQADEGELTRARASLVRESSLALIARRLELGDQLALGPGELKSGGYRRDSILADALEAVAAAIYLDAGFDALKLQALAWFEPLFAALPATPEKDPKTRLQEWLQARARPLPQYEILAAEGEEHARRFVVRCRVGDDLSAEAEGGSRRQAEQAAAAAILQALGEAP